MPSLSRLVAGHFGSRWAGGLGVVGSGGVAGEVFRQDEGPEAEGGPNAVSIAGIVAVGSGLKVRAAGNVRTLVVHAVFVPHAAASRETPSIQTLYKIRKLSPSISRNALLVL